MATDIKGSVLFGHYRVQEPIGEGAFSEVWRAQDEVHGRTVAIKFIKSTAPGRLVERLEREGRILARLEHPNVVRIISSGVFEGRRALVLEHVEGGTLREHIASLSSAPVGAVPLGQIAPLFAQICAGVASAHDAGVLHRDLKPENVLVWQDKRGRLGAKVVDFGLGRLGETSASSVALTVGTFEYMSPEQATAGEHDAPDASSDVFSLGVMLLEMLSGTPLPDPGRRVSWERVVDRGHHGEQLAKARERLPGVEEKVWAVVRRCIAPAAERYANGEALLDAWLAATGQSSVPLVSMPQRAPLADGSTHVGRSAEMTEQSSAVATGVPPSVAVFPSMMASEHQLEAIRAAGAPRGAAMGSGSPSKAAPSAPTHSVVPNGTKPATINESKASKVTSPGLLDHWWTAASIGTAVLLAKAMLTYYNRGFYLPSDDDWKFSGFGVLSMPKLSLFCLGSLSTITAQIRFYALKFRTNDSARILGFIAWALFLTLYITVGWDDPRFGTKWTIFGADSFEIYIDRQVRGQMAIGICLFVVWIFLHWRGSTVKPRSKSKETEPSGLHRKSIDN